MPTTATQHQFSTIFDDDFAEASIEAISLAAIRAPSSLSHHHQSLPFDENLFPAPLAPRSAIRRAISSFSSRARSDVRATSFVSSPAMGGILASGEIKLTPMGEWHRDVLALPHNAIRAEIADLASMTGFVKEGTGAVAANIGRMAQWWKGFETFLGDWFSFESSVLLPWIYRGGEADDLRELRNKMKGHAAYVMELGTEVGNVFALYAGEPSLDVLPLLLRCVEEFVEGVLAFVDMEERVLPGLVRRGHTRREAFNVTRLMCRRIDVILLTRWIASRRERSAVRRLYMNPASWITFYAKRKRIYSEHLAIVAAVCMGVGVR